MFDHTALAVVLDEGIVLLCCSAGERLEPVCVVCHAILLSPLLHAVSHGVGDAAVECGAIVDYVYKLVVDVGWQVFVHFGTVENVFSEIL